jgi:hypothetical protein
MFLALPRHLWKVGDDLWPLTSLGGFRHLGQGVNKARIERWGQIVVY